MPNRFVFALADPAVDLPLAGGKGANLGRLVQAGLPVPPGFVIATPAYQAYVAANDLSGVIAAAVAATDPAQPASFEAASAAIRAVFERGTLPADLAAAISQAYVTLGPGEMAVAVRSSATAEDLPQASFAGQQHTFLNVRGWAALQHAVVRCWSSLWTARAMAYRAARHIPSATVALAVVVQQLVPAEAAGVLFTLNPLDGNANEMLVNATWGLGEALVAGQVNPDTLCLDKATGRINSLTLGDKAIMTAASESGTVDVPVPAAQRQASVLDAALAADLARLARQIEAAFAAPQDVEWALAQGRLYILQSRPITAAGPAPTPGPVPGDDAWPPLPAGSQPYDLWTQADVGERWPEPVTPFSWSTWHIILNQNMRDSLGYLKAPYVLNGQWARRAYGRIYFNEGLMTEAFVREFGMPASLISASMGTQGAAPGRDRWRWGTFLRALPRFLAHGWQMDRDVREYERRFPQIEAWVEAFWQRDLAAEADPALWAEAQRLWWPRMMEHMALHASVTSVSIVNLPMLESLTARATGSRDAVQPLLTGLSGVIQAEMVPDLVTLARQAESAGLAPRLLDSQVPAARRLSDLRQLPEAAEWLAALEVFLVRHGHRCPTEAEWLFPRWREAPELVLDLVAGYLRSGAAGPDLAAQARLRLAATAEVQSRLSPLIRPYFRSLLRRVQYLVRMRDNGQHYLVKLVSPIRRLYAVLAGRWAQRGWLSRADDFFYLTLPEVESILAQGQPSAAALAAAIAARRLAYAHWFTVTAPEVIDSSGQPVDADAPAAGSDANVLVGVAASRGRVTGEARLVASPQAISALRPGDILVTRATDPGWTPVFSMVSAVVLEVGGQLSHGAIVAREYGLPAVVNVAGATRRIADGQTITVDGTAGRVYLA